MARRHPDDDLSEPMLRTRLSRRGLLRRAALLGGATPLVAGLLAACGGGESTSAPELSATTSSAGAATPSTGGSSASPAATAAASPAGGSGQAVGGKFTSTPPQHQGGQIIEGTYSDAKVTSPINSEDGPSNTLIAMMFEGLIQANPATAEVMGCLAKSWEISDDGVTYTFTLNEGVTWHDGEPFTANDVKFTFDLASNKDAKSPLTSSLTKRIEKIEVPDDGHIVYTLKEPNAAFLASDCDTRIIPQHILKDVKPADVYQHPFTTGKKGVTVGTGPFMFEEWIKDDHCTLVKNPNYWQGAPALDRWIYKVVPNQTVLAQQLKTGELDYGTIQPADAADMQQLDNLSVELFDSFSFTHSCFNLDPAKTKVFQDKAVRQALFYTLDRKAMIEAIKFGYSTVAVGTMPLLSWAYNPDGIKLKYDYDLDKAKQLLDDAGWAPGPDGIREKDGVKLSFTALTNSGNQVREQYVTVYQQQWKKLGVEVKPELIEWNAFLDRIAYQRNYDLYLESFGWGVDPDQSGMWACDSYEGAYNDAKYCNPEVDKLLKDGLATTDQDERKRIYTDMQNILMEDLPQMILDFDKTIVGVSKRTHNIFPNAVNLRFNAHQWWVDG